MKPMVMGHFLLYAKGEKVVYTKLTCYLTLVSGAFILGKKIKLQLPFLSFLNTEMASVGEILPWGKQGIVYIEYHSF